MSKNISDNIINFLATLLSTVVISGINIIISGHILGKVLSLEGSDKNFFELKIPAMFRLRITGEKVFAGFASFSISMLFVGLCMPNMASKIFITNTQATNSQWTAVQSLAASLSVIFCLFLAIIKLSYLAIKLIIIEKNRKKSDPSPEERARLLIDANNRNNEDVT